MKKRWIATVITGLGITVLMSVGALAQSVGTDIYNPGGAGKYGFADPAFQQIWNRTDRPYQDSKVSRTWFWGPGANSIGLLEKYVEDPLDRGVHLVQYFDKSRMEINNPKGDRNNAFFVTNGLLTVELISGFMQVGNDSFVQSHPACLPMAGDSANTLAPTYSDFAAVSNTRLGNHFAADRTGQRTVDTMLQGGTLGTDSTKGSLAGTEFAHYDTTTHHNIPKITWDFLNSAGPIYDNTGKITNARLMNPWYFASGLPISEPYWAKAPIRGQVTDVMIQAFERVVFTYVPSNIPGWKVEYGNIGQHYFDWRYRGAGLCAGAVLNTPDVPRAAGTAVVLPTDTPRPTATDRPVPPTATVRTEPATSTLPPRTATQPPATQPVETNTTAPINTATNTSTRLPATGTSTAIPPTARPTFTFTPSRTPTHASTFTPSNTPTDTRTPSPTRSPTDTPTKTSTPTRAQTDSPDEHRKPTPSNAAYSYISYSSDPCR